MDRAAALQVVQVERFGLCCADRKFYYFFQPISRRNFQKLQNVSLARFATWRRGAASRQRHIFDQGVGSIDKRSCARPVGTMERKSQMDAFGAAALIAFALHLAFNQVVIKVTNGGFGPVFAAGLRSTGAVIVLLIWMRVRGVSLHVPRDAVAAGLISGFLFGLEFMCLFSALDFTTVSRASVIFYSMPVWLTIASHFLIPGDQFTRRKAIGLTLAMGGVALALMDRSDATASLLGDVLALTSALCWAAIALCVKATPLSRVPPAQQLMFQVIVSAPILLIASLFFGDFIRDVQPIHIAGLAFQIIAVASLGFLAWFWLMSIYPASSVATFSFLSPVFAVILGWLLLDEHVGPQVWAALGFVSAGIYLINTRGRSRALA
jgi:drug/metabolite transporter (DMT)-like permease